MGPLSTKKILELRFACLEKVRSFFSKRGVLEVDTNTLTEFPALDPNIDPFSTAYFAPGTETKKNPQAGTTLYLHTSPEFAMKRLLADGSGPIYQIAHVFRNGEWGKIHNPEFTMLEWYRPGFTLHDLMDEVSVFLEEMLPSGEPSRRTYKELFEEHFSVNPHSVTRAELIEKCVELKISPPESFKQEKDALLQFLLTEKIEPGLGVDRPEFIFHFPKSQAACAKIKEGPCKVAERFEVYFRGVELANGYHELTDPVEQETRFKRENRRRVCLGKKELPADTLLIGALEKGLADCSGVALGFDRMIMLSAKRNSIHDILPLSWRM
ncbi:MAG: EF-P lysine aminoacylase EpmA [Nitrospinota bacterium]